MLKQRKPATSAAPAAARPRRPQQGQAGQADALAGLAGRSARVQAQAGLAQLVGASPRVQAQKRMCTLVAQGRRMAAQRDETPVPAAGGLPPGLRRGIYQLSGIDLGGVQVHRHSAAPARLQAHAFAQGRQIHLGPGQERHLPHEAWHVVQQLQGRVKATVQARGIALNDSRALETEADRMGARAATLGRNAGAMASAAAPLAVPAPVVQGFWLRRQGEPECINNARKVDAVLAPEPAQALNEGSGPQPASAGATVYRLAPSMQVPWEAIGRLITALGAAKVQAIEVRGYPLWGRAEGLAAIDRQLENLAKLNLHLLQTLFAQSAADISQLLTRASQSDFARLFSGPREARLTWLEQGGYRSLKLPLPPAAAPAAAQGAAPDGATTKAGAEPGLAAPAGADQRRSAVQAAVIEKIAGAGTGVARGGPAQQLLSLAQQWAAGRVAGNVSLADSARARGTAVLDTMSLPGAADGGIFSGVRERVRTAVSAGPYQGADVVVARRPGLGVITGNYTDQQGRLHVGAVSGAFTGQLSGVSDGPAAQAVQQMMASGHGPASARLQAHTLPGQKLAGQLDGGITLANAFLTLTTQTAQFEGRGVLHARMDGALYRPDTRWSRLAQADGAALLRADPGRQLLTDGAGNRAVLAPATIEQAMQGDGPDAAVNGHLHGSSNGWQHPVRNGQRYSDLKVTLNPTQRTPAGLFQPDTLHQIVQHAGSAGLAEDYVRADGPVGRGPATLHGALLARALTVEGTLGQLASAKQLSHAAARMAAMRFALSTPVLKPDSKAPDLQYASTLQAGNRYALSYQGKRYEFTLEALVLPASWSDGHFQIPFRLAYQALAHYAPVS